MPVASLAFAKPSGRHVDRVEAVRLTLGDIEHVLVIHRGHSMYSPDALRRVPIMRTIGADLMVVTLFANGPDVLVDLSNVCRAEDLCGPRERASWGGLARVLQAMNKGPLKFGKVHLVADRSLYRLLDDHGKSEVKRFKSKGLLEETPLADERLIGFMYDSDSPFNMAVCVSRDFFDDFRRDYPDIQGSQDRFLDWKVLPSGGIDIAYRDMQQRTHQHISRKIEVGEMKARRLLRQTVQERAVERDYKCNNSGCVLAQLWPDRLREFPEYDRRIDGFICPSCGDKLEGLERRTPTTQLVVYFDGEEQMRVLLEEGSTIEIGREDAKGILGLSRHLSQEIVQAVSRQQLSLELRSGRVFAADLGSKNGTLVDPRKGGATRPLESQPEQLTSQHRLLLPGGITIELSGQRAPFEGERPINETIIASREILETIMEF